MPYFLYMANNNIECIKEYPTEDEFFVINGKPLTEKKQISLEYDKLKDVFIHEYLTRWDLVKLNTFRAILNDLSSSLDKREIDFETLKKIIVHLDLEFGTEIHFTDTFVNMFYDEELNENYEDKTSELTLKFLCDKYKKDGRK